MKFDYLDRKTQSVYAPQANMVVPYGGQEALQAQPDVTLEMGYDGSQYLHLVMPADKINFLNGVPAGKGPFFGNESAGADCADKLMVEVGCKVFEVNKVAY